MRTASRNNGAVNAETESDKHARYPEGLMPWRAISLAHETFGRIGPQAISHLKKLAKEAVAMMGGEEVWGAHTLLARWGARLSMALHRASARLLRSAWGASRDARRFWFEKCAHE